MADQWAEVREIQDQIAAKTVEHDRALRRPWRIRRNAQLRSDLRYLRILLSAAAKDAGARSRRSCT
jgi:hypothetical protein